MADVCSLYFFIFVVTRDFVSSIPGSMRQAFGKYRFWLPAVAVSLTLVISFILIYRNSLRLMDDEAWVRHTHEVIGRLEALLAAMVDVETGQRGFVIAGDPVFLEPYSRGTQLALERLEQVRELTVDNSRQRALIAELEPVLRHKLEITEHIVQVRREQGAGVATGLVAAGEGKLVMDRFRVLLDEMLEEERRLLNLRSVASRQAAQWANYQFILISIIDLVTIAIGFFAIRRFSRISENAESRLAEQQVRYGAELGQARRATERAALFKDELLANIYHELRTPLNSIMGWSEVLESSSQLDEEARGASAAIHRNGQALLKLIENLLDAAESVRGGKVPTSAPTPVLPMLRAALERLQTEMDAKGVTAHIEDRSHNAYVMINEPRGRTALEHVLDNAIKFSPPGGCVRVEIERGQDCIQVGVRDEGSGISPEQRETIFKVFHQGDASVTRAHGGLGIGLFMSRFFLEAYGGSLNAVPSPKGAHFVITLPAATP